MGSIGCVCCEKFRRDFVARNFALVRPNSPECNQIVRNTPKRQIRDNGLDRVHSLRKIPTRLRGTNFCTSSASNAPKQYETHQNVSLWSNGEDWVHSLRKIPTRLRGTNFCTSSARFAPSFVRLPNSPECTQIIRNAPKRQFRVQLG